MGIHDEDYVTQREIANDPTTDIDMLIDFARNSDCDIQDAVAKNPSLPVSVLAELARNPEESVRCAVTENPNVTPDILYDMASQVQSNEYSVVEYLAINPKTPTDALTLLVNKCIIEDDDYSSDLPSFIAENPNTSLDVLQWLLTNELLCTGCSDERIAKERLGLL